MKYNCTNCYHKIVCSDPHGKDHSCSSHTKMNNADLIRSMSDEELARYIDVNMLPDSYLNDHYMSEKAIDVILHWLKQEVE